MNEVPLYVRCTRSRIGARRSEDGEEGGGFLGGAVAKPHAPLRREAVVRLSLAVCPRPRRGRNLSGRSRRRGGARVVVGEAHGACADRVLDGRASGLGPHRAGGRRHEARGRGLLRTPLRAG